IDLRKMDKIPGRYTIKIIIPGKNNHTKTLTCLNCIIRRYVNMMEKVLNALDKYIVYLFPGLIIYFFKIKIRLDYFENFSDLIRSNVPHVSHYYLTLQLSQIPFIDVESHLRTLA